MQRKRNFRVKAIDDEADQEPDEAEAKAAEKSAPKASLLSFDGFEPNNEPKLVHGRSKTRIRLPDSLVTLPLTREAPTPSTQYPATGKP